MGINAEVFSKKGEDPKRMVKRFIKKCKKEGFLKEVVERSRYKKPSDVKRMKAKKRKKVLQKLRREEEKKNRDY